MSLNYTTNRKWVRAPLVTIRDLETAVLAMLAIILMAVVKLVDHFNKIK